jgi:hypothetical protein
MTNETKEVQSPRCTMLAPIGAESSTHSSAIQTAPFSGAVRSKSLSIVRML